MTIITDSFSQSKFDTLFIGSSKYPLKRTNIFRVSQTGPVDLPSEYEKFEDYSKKVRIDYKFKSDTVDAVELLEDGTEIRVKKYGGCQCAYEDKYINLFSFADTIKLSYKEFSSLHMYIKSSGKRTNFYSSKVSCIYKDTLIEVLHQNMSNGQIFSYWHLNTTIKGSELSKLRETTFVLQDLYYVRKNTTYYLDRQYIITVK